MANELIKSFLAPQLGAVQQNDTTDLSQVSKEREVPPWRVSTTKFQILSESQKSDLRNVNDKLQSIQKQLQKTQDLLNSTLGRLVSILKAIEDPLATLFDLLGTEILKLDATFNNNMGIFMLDDLSEQIKLKFTLFGKTFDYSDGLNIAGGINNTAFEAKKSLYKKFGVDLVKQNIPTPAEAGALARKDLRLKEFIVAFDQYNEDVLTILSKLKSVYSKAESSFRACVVKDTTLLPYAQPLKNHYLVEGKIKKGTDGTVVQNDRSVNGRVNDSNKSFIYFKLPSLAKKLATMEGEPDPDRYTTEIVTELVDGIYVGTDVASIPDANKIIIYPKIDGTSNPAPTDDVYQIDHSYSTITDKDYLEKIANQKEETESSFTQTQRSVLSNNEDKAIFSLIGQALYEFEKAAANKGLTQFQLKTKTYEIIEKYFRKRLDKVAPARPINNTYLSSSPVFDETIVKNAVIAPYTGVISSSVSTISSNDKIPVESRREYTVYFTKEDGKKRIETDYGLDNDLASLQLLEDKIITETSTGKSRERLVLSNITNKIQSLINMTNRTDVHLQTTTIQPEKNTRTIVPQPSQILPKVIIPSAQRNQIKIIEESIIKQIDIINSFEDIRKYKKEYYTKTLDGLLLSLENKFSKLQEVYDRIKLRGTDLSVLNGGVLSSVELLNTQSSNRDQFVAEASIMIQILSSIKATFQPFLLNKSTIEKTIDDLNRVISDNANSEKKIEATETSSQTLKTLLQDEKYWLENVVGTDEKAIKLIIEEYLKQFKELLSGRVSGYDIDVTQTREDIKNETPGDLVFDINGLANPNGSNDVGNVFVLYQDGFAENTERQKYTHLASGTKTSEDLISKTIFVRYYAKDNIERVSIENEIIEPGNFIKEYRIGQKVRQLKNQIENNLRFNKEDSTSIIKMLSDQLDGLLEYLSCKDDSQTTTPGHSPQQEKDTTEQNKIEKNLEYVKNTIIEREKQLNENIKKIDYTNNTITAKATDKKALVDDTNKLIKEIGGYLYKVDGQSIRITSTIVEGSLRKTERDLQKKYDTLSNKINSSQLDLLSEIKMDSTLSKLDAQISALKQKISEMKDAATAEKIKVNELEPLEDLRRKMVDGTLTNANELDIFTRTVQQLTLLQAAEREFARIEDEIDEVKTAVNSSGTIIIQTTQNSVTNEVHIDKKQFEAFNALIFSGVIKNFIIDNGILSESTANSDIAKLNNTAIFKDDGSINDKPFNITSNHYNNNVFNNERLYFNNNKDDDATAQETFTNYGIFKQIKDNKYNLYDDKYFVENIFFADTDGSFDFSDTSTDNILNLYEKYIGYQLDISGLQEYKSSVLTKFRQHFLIFKNDFIVSKSDTKTESFKAIDITTKLNYYDFKSYLKNKDVKIINSIPLRKYEAEFFDNPDGVDEYLTNDYKDAKNTLLSNNSSYQLFIGSRKSQLVLARTEFDNSIKKLSKGIVANQEDDNRSFFHLNLRSKNEWIEQIITAFSNEDDFNRPLFPDDLSSNNPLKSFNPRINPTTNPSLIDDDEVEKLKKKISDLTGGLSFASSQINKNTDMAVIFYVVTTSDVLGLLNKISPIYDTFIGMREGRTSALIVKFDEYQTKLERTFSEVSDAVNELYTNIKGDIDTVVDTAISIKDDPLKAAGNAAKAFLAIDCSEEAKIENALKFSTKLPEEFSSGIIHKWISLRLKDLPPFTQISKLSLGLSGLLKSLARPKIGLATVLERILNNLNKKIDLLKKIIVGINLMIEFIDFIGSFQIDATTLELENVRSVSFIEQALRTSENFPMPFGVLTDDDKMFIASIAFVMPMPLVPLFKKFFKITDRRNPVEFTSPLLTDVTNQLTQIGETTTLTTDGTINTTGNTDGDTLII